jgi:hypothetical protein
MRTPFRGAAMLSIIIIIPLPYWYRMPDSKLKRLKLYSTTSYRHY